MDMEFSIDKIREAQNSFYPDGGRRAVHEVRHRSALRKFADRMREDRFALVCVILISLLSALLSAALLSPDSVRSGLGALLPSSAVKLIAGEHGMSFDRDRLKSRFDSLSDDEKREIREFVNAR